MDGQEETWGLKRETTDEVSVVSNANSNPDSKKRRSWKKPKDKPMRPLSAYNMFFQNQRERIVAGKTGDPTPQEIEHSVIKMLTSKTRGPKRRQDRVSHGQISFADLARTIAAKWKEIDPKLKVVYNHYAAQEKVRYKKEVVIWKEKKEKELIAKQNGLLNSSSSLNDSMASMASSNTSMSTSMASSYNLSESINSLHGSVNMQMHDDVAQRQQDILRQQMGFVDSKPPARIGGGGNDIVPREVPKLERGSGGDDAGSQVFQFPRPFGVTGSASIMGVEDSNTKTDDKLDSNLRQHSQQQQQFNQKEQLLLQLQHQQLQQLQQLELARNESSRLSNMKTTNTASTFLDNVQSSNTTRSGQLEFTHSRQSSQATSNLSNTKQLFRNQFKELENITYELDRLKEQERQMQHKITEHQHLSNPSLWEDDMAFGNSFNQAPPVTTSANHNASEFSNLNSDISTNFSIVDANSSLLSTFDQVIDDRERVPVSRSRSGDTGVYGRGHSSISNSFNGQRRQLRRHSGNFGTSSTPNSFNYGSRGECSVGQQNFNTGLPGRDTRIEEGCQHQSQIQGCGDSLSALLQLENINNNDGIGDERRQRERHQQAEQEQLQSHRNSLAALLQLQETQGNGADHDIGSIFTMELGG